MTDFAQQSGWKPTPWMKEKVGQVLVNAMTNQGDIRVAQGPRGLALTVPLGGIGTDAGSEEDITCDKCHKVFPKGLWAFALDIPNPVQGIWVLITGGFCDACADEEGVDKRERIE